MKVAILACVAGLALCGTAEARPMFCSLDDTAGNSLTYLFDTSPTVWVELEFAKNGASVVHPPGARPRWPMQDVPGRPVYVMTYLPDPRYRLVANAYPKHLPQMQNIPVYMATVGRAGDRQPQAKGMCVFKDEIDRRGMVGTDLETPYE